MKENSNHQKQNKGNNTKQPEILLIELKVTINKLKNSIENFTSRLNHIEERISDRENRTLEIT